MKVSVKENAKEYINEKAKDKAITITLISTGSG